MNRNLWSGHQPWLALAVAFAALAPLSSRAGVVNYAWSPVGNPGNAPDPATGGLYGAVNYNYNIGTYDVTTGQYTAFLNAVAATDSYGLYDPNMATTNSGQLPSGGNSVGISRSGSPGSYGYSVIGNPNVPVFDVSWGDAARIANWMQNAQPTDLGEAAGSTETGAYTLNGAVTNNALSAVRRNANAAIFLPSLNEWYKAAYYKGGGTNAGYWKYPTRSNSDPSNVLFATGTNNANFNARAAPNGSPDIFTDPVNFLTSVGAFAGSPGPYGTYDMGGDVMQWDDGFRIHGGAWENTLPPMQAGAVIGTGGPAFESVNVGLRLASLPVPEPSTWLLATVGVGGLWIARQRRRATVSAVE